MSSPRRRPHPRHGSSSEAFVPLPMCSLDTSGVGGPGPADLLSPWGQELAGGDPKPTNSAALPPSALMSPLLHRGKPHAQVPGFWSPEALCSEGLFAWHCGRCLASESKR